MNERFFLLPQEKQQRILNAGYKVFSEYPYKKSPMSEIADEAGISKSLLFHYFHNKKDLYIYLFEYAKEITNKELLKAGIVEATDFFALLEKSLLAKCNLTRRYPYISAFSLRAFYEQESEIKDCIHHIFWDLYNDNSRMLQNVMENSRFRAGIDIEFMYKEITWAMNGYMHMVYMSGEINADKIESDLSQLIDFWKQMYLKDEESNHVV